MCISEIHGSLLIDSRRSLDFIHLPLTQAQLVNLGPRLGDVAGADLAGDQPRLAFQKAQQGDVVTAISGQKYNKQKQSLNDAS